MHRINDNDNRDRSEVHGDYMIALWKWRLFGKTMQNNGLRESNTRLSGEVDVIS